MSGARLIKINEIEWTRKKKEEEEDRMDVRTAGVRDANEQQVVAGKHGELGRKKTLNTPLCRFSFCSQT